MNLLHTWHPPPHPPDGRHLHPLGALHAKHLSTTAAGRKHYSEAARHGVGRVGREAITARGGASERRLFESWMMNQIPEHADRKSLHGFHEHEHEHDVTLMLDKYFILLLFHTWSSWMGLGFFQGNSSKNRTQRVLVLRPVGSNSFK